MASIVLRGNGGAGSSQTLTTEQFTGADCSGADRSENRVLTTSGVSSASGDVIVVVDRQTLREDTDYTMSGDDITFLTRISNSQKIDVRYMA